MQFEPVIDVVALVAATVAAVVIGFIWYHPKVFGTIWGNALGMDMDKKPTGAEMGKNMGFMILGALSTAFVFLMVTQAFTPDAWLHDGDTLTASMALQGAFFVWIGFNMPILYSRVTWEGGKMVLLWVNGAYYIVQLAAMAMIFLWRLG